MNAAAPVGGRRRAALAFIFITIVLDIFALGMIIPVLPHLIEDFLGGDTAGAAKVYGVFGAVWALMQFLSMPVLTLAAVMPEITRPTNSHARLGASAIST